jgi:large conductance mechanosensitive channel
MSDVLKGFKDFIMRGNLIEIAVAFVIGGAFATVVTATVAIIMDIIGKVGGTPNFSGYQPGGVHVGDWITAVIAFVILAAVVYFLIMVPYNKLQERITGGKETAPPAADIALLTEIRDLLAGRPGPDAPVEMDRSGA